MGFGSSEKASWKKWNCSWSLKIRVNKQEKWGEHSRTGICEQKYGGWRREKCKEISFAGMANIVEN